MSGPSKLERAVLAYAIAAVCVIAALGATPVAALTAKTSDPGLVSVGYSGSPDLLSSTIALLGGTVVARDAALMVEVVQANSVSSLINGLVGLSTVRYAEADEIVRSAGDGGTATRWTATSTDATRWTTTSATATLWTDAEASATRWTGTGWDATRWTGNSSDGSTTGFTADPGMIYQWGLGAINAPGAWLTSVGHRARTLCVLDTGIDASHPDLRANLWTAPDGSHGWNYVADTNDTTDDAGHGSHVAGIAAAVGGNGLGVIGVAQERIMAVKVLDATGAGKESDAAFGLRWCADHGANIASLSLGTDKDKRVLQDGVAYARSHNVLIVAAAGNDGCACARYPAAYAGVLAVASYDRNGAHSLFSNTGSWISLAAPGENITSTYKGGAYAIGSGTSQATPFVAGTAALVWDVHPSYSADQVASLLTTTARDMGAAGRDALFGYGSVDAHKAMTVATGG